VVLDREGLATKAPVRLGVQMQGKVQLLKGVEPGERMVLTREVEPGIRLRERK
jgi:hypothetical protein